jgi:hypothetical protein
VTDRLVGRDPRCRENVSFCVEINQIAQVLDNGAVGVEVRKVVDFSFSSEVELGINPFNFDQGEVFNFHEALLR